MTQEASDFKLFYGEERPLCEEVVFKAKPSYPEAPSPSPEGTLGPYIIPPKYTKVQDDTWAALCQQQEQLIFTRSCPEYLEAREAMDFPKDRVPYLRDVSARLKKLSGWEVVFVSGFVQQPIFFEFLANKKFPCTDFVRHPDEIGYTPAPDMFHDLMGHLPLITNDKYASFFHNFGIAGANAKTEEEMLWLARIYWFTVEFGLIKADKGVNDPHFETQIYGAGIVSSLSEIEHCLSDKVSVHPFDIDVIAAKDYDIHEMQTDYFRIESFEQLDKEFTVWAMKKGLLPSA